MKNIAVSLSFVLLSVPFIASAETYYFGGNETQVSSGTSKKTGEFEKSGAPTTVFVEMVVEGDKISQRVLKNKTADTMTVSGIQLLKSGGGWIWNDPTTKKAVPVNVAMSGGRVKTITRTIQVKDRVSVLKIDMSDPVLFKQSSTVKIPGGQVSYSTVIDAGMMLQNQFQAQVKNKKFEPAPPMHGKVPPGTDKK